MTYFSAQQRQLSASDQARANILPLEQFHFHDKKLNFMDALAEIENAERCTVFLKTHATLFFLFAETKRGGSP